MISVSVLTWQKIILILMLLTSCSGQITYYVTPTPDVPCPGQPCHTLSEYVADQYFQNFTVNTTMEFLSGNHSLEQTISVTNLTWLTLNGDSSSLPEVTSRIICTWPAGFIFTNVTELHISALGFLSCGHNDSAAVSMISVQQSDISNCIFQNSTNKNGEKHTYCYGTPFNPNAIGKGGALYIDTSNLILIGNTFQNNSAVTDNRYCMWGGALYVWLSYITLTENSFQSNSASIGGAVIVLNGTLKLTGNVFQSNRATYCGGALFIEYGMGSLKNNTFQNNNTSQYGGAVCVYNSTLNLTGNTFLLNFAQLLGGALVIETNTNLSLIRNTFANNFAALQGGAISTNDSILNLKENTFQSNSAHQGGALLIQFNNTLSLTGNKFCNNSASEGSGGALSIHHSSLNLTENTFHSNTASTGGALSVDTCNHLSITGNTFWNNSAYSGGALAVDYSTLNLTENVFMSNVASGRGGTLYIYAGTDMTATNDSFYYGWAQLGGAILAFDNSTVRMHYCTIKQNTAQYGGGIATFGSQLELGNTNFIANIAAYGGGLYAYSSRISGKATVLVTNNTATEGGGGVYAESSVFHFKGNITIMNNAAVDGNGGGLLLSNGSKFYLQPYTHMYFISNSAKSSGGGIKIEEYDPLTSCILVPDVGSSDCFFQLENETEHWMNKSASEIIEELNVGIYFGNNSAVDAGADLHGGSIDNCAVNNINTGNSGKIFDSMIHTITKNTPDISSDPLYICLCRDNVTDCSGFYFPEPTYPGGTVEVPIMARGQRNGTTAAVIQVLNAPSIFLGTDSIQSINNSCATLRYTLHTKSSQEFQSIVEISLNAEGPCLPTINNTLKVIIHIKPCIRGFYLSYDQTTCICDRRLQQFTNTCLIDNQTVLRAHGAEFWVGYDNRTQGLILSPYCPFDYCTSEKIYLSIEDSDKQCNYKRSGLLCGRCSENLSLALGSSHCLQCSISHLALLPVFAFAGIALVLLLLLLRLTVAAGTINGLIFYANVVASNLTLFYPPEVTNVLTVFIAWLNLDLGFQTCFYDGMNAYVKTWLQFVFPLYVWALVGLIILASHFSGRIARMFGNNPIAVLATLFLLSYAKLLRTAFAVLFYTTLEYPNHEEIVWTYDGNIRYFRGKHIPLFIAAVSLIFLFLLYTMLLIFSQWLQANSMFRIFSWVNSLKIKPFLDAYHAPYTNKHRYWTGVMLLLRFALLLISAFPFNTLSDPSVNLLAVVSATTALLTFLAILDTRVYKKWSLCLLEISFLLNLDILAVATLYIHFIVQGNQSAATFTSVGIAFVTFIGIVIYHSVQQMKGTWLYERVSRCQRHNYVLVPVNDQDPPDVGYVPGPANDQDLPDVGYVPGPAPTHTVVDIHDREACTTTN